MQIAKCEECGKEQKFTTYKRDWPAGWILRGKSKKYGKRYHHRAGFAWWCPDCQQPETIVPSLPAPALRALGWKEEKGKNVVKTVTRIVSELDNLEFGYWRQINEEEGEFVPLSSAADFEKAAVYFDCSAELLDTLHVLHDSLLDAIKVDLVSIWKRLDRLSNNP